MQFKPFPLTPFIVRDISIYINDNEELLKSIIEENKSDLVQKWYTRDIYIDNQGEKSITHRLIYQDWERTLTNEEVNKEVEIIINKIKENGFVIK